MTAVSICDTLIVTENALGRIRLGCSWCSGNVARYPTGSGAALGDLPPVEENIVFRAAERLRRQAGVESGVDIQLVKRIPSAAGMGGASSDAAAALVALNELWQLRWPAARLREVAAQSGSDVPFFVASRGPGVLTAVCRGRGERIERVLGVPPLHVVVVRPPAGLSTPAVYRHCSIPAQPRRLEELLEALRQGNAARAGSMLFNRLQESAARLSPWIDRLRRRFDALQLWGHQMSGSGSSYFGICRHRRHAQQVAARLRGNEIGEVFCATTIPG